MRTANLALAFFLELAVMAALAYWGFQTIAGAAGIALGIGAAVLMGVVWGLWLAPRARYPLPALPHEILKDLVLSLGVVALLLAGNPLYAAILVVLLILNRGLAYIWGQGW
jgi:hypothetical protein